MEITRTHWISSLILFVGLLGMCTQASGMIWQKECADSISQLAERQREISQSHHKIEMIRLSKQFSPNFQVNWNVEKNEKDKDLSHAVTSLKMTLSDFNADLSQFQKKCLE